MRAYEEVNCQEMVAWLRSCTTHSCAQGNRKERLEAVPRAQLGRYVTLRHRLDFIRSTAAFHW
jgi:hypothetical protein